MWVFFCIGIRMVQAVHDSICLRAHIRRPLRYISHDKEKALPAFAHGKGPMRRIPMLQKGLGKERRIPQRDKKDNDYHKQN